jgi:hypothetical protein
VLGSGIYLNPLTITSTGEIKAPAPGSTLQAAGAIDVSLNPASITNYGLISAAIPATDSATCPAILASTPLILNNYGTVTGQSGVYLQAGGTLTNGGSITGLQALGTSGYGVRLTNAELNNSSTVYGARYGIANLGSGEVTNSGTITGGMAGIKLPSADATISGTLINTGRVSGGSGGITEANALIINSGTIIAETYGVRVSWGGSVTNSGYISAGVDGVLLLNQKTLAQYAASFTNSGTVQGNYFGVAVNSAIVTNTAAGLITGTTFGAGVGYAGDLYNAGNVYGAAVGLILTSGGSATNTGLIHGNSLGIEALASNEITNASGGSVYSLDIAALDQTADLVNAGVMQGDSCGLELSGGGLASNTGIILSQNQGVYLSTLSTAVSPNFLENAGYIYGIQSGVDLQGGTVTNSGTIGANVVAVRLASATSLSNSGTIYGVAYGVQLSSGTMLNSGSIGGGNDGIRATGGTITDSGTISGTSYAIYGTSFAMIVDPGAIFTGDVVDKTKTSRLNLAGATPGTLTGLGTQFNAFNTISFQTGADWLISGTSLGLTENQAINGFAPGDTIVINGFSASGERYVAGKGLELINGSTIETLHIAGTFITANFSVASTGTASTIKLQANAPCFVAGTAILTPRGEIPVESLTIGDTVITRTGEDQPILWIGCRTPDLRRHPCPAAVLPVCISANALAEGVPRRDLWVSPDHAMFIDDVLIPAQLLLNGLNIYRGVQANVTYYHLELPQHSVIFAENAPAETYLETGDRNAFGHVGASLILHPDFSAEIRREKSCAKLLLRGSQLDEIRQRNLRRMAGDVSRRYSYRVSVNN